MACPRVELSDRTVILLSGFPRGSTDRSKDLAALNKIEKPLELRQTAQKHPDAIAFGFVAGRWMPAA